MFSLSNLKIGTRLLFGFGLVLLCALSLLVLGLWRMGELQDASDSMVNKNVASLSSAADMREMGWVALLTLRRIAIPTDAREADIEQKKLAATLAAYAAAETKLGTRLSDTRGKALFETTAQQYSSLGPVVGKVRALAAEGDYFNAASTMQNDFLPLHAKWMHSLGELARSQQEAMSVKYQAAQQKYVATRDWMIMVGVLTTAFCAFFGWKITKTVSMPMRRAVDIANAIANGNLTAQRQATSLDEAGQLLNALYAMQANLIVMLEQIQSGSETIDVAAEHIASGNAELASRTESQASSLQQTSATMASLTEAVQKNAAHTEQANALTHQAARCAEQGGEVVHKVVATMGLVKASSTRMSDIIGVIDGIAFQTNILALNAAVEAARAGEMGRGFAVVATEVRNLAQRSATAAKEIKQLIVDSMETVDAGSALVNQAGTAVEQIVESVHHVAEIMNDITAANVAQRTGIAEVNTAVAQIDEFTQHNAALVDRAAAAAASMSEQTHLLKQTVSVFKLERAVGSTDAPARMAPKPRPRISA